MKFTPLLITLVFGCEVVLAQKIDSIKFYTTQHLEGEAPKIDGQINDPAWQQVPWGGGDFTQVSPDAGAKPSVQTKFKILYDAKNLYIAIKNLDPDPSKIVSRMSRRDGFEGDFVEVNIDSYYDKRTAFSFTASVSGVKGDEYVSNNGNNWDSNWDPIWYLKTSIDKDGWIAEMRIPLSQLRFADKPEHVWGLQFTRRFFRNQERSLWQYIPPDASGWVHLFGELRGIKGIRPQKQLEIQPYVVAKTERMQKEEGNPFATGKASSVAVGMDAKIGITSDITLDLTVNPDFGQVEADPSQVNLTAFRLFFQERRPFFIEGNNTLNFPVVDFNSNNLFYSRRIGRKPQGNVETDKDDVDDGVNEYVKPTSNTTILGAAKLTGKNKKGFSWGILESVTSLEKTTIDSLGYRRQQIVEPLTNYFVARAQQDINKGNTIIGGMFTATNRKITDERLKWLHDNAYSSGVDLVHNWKARKYFVSAKMLMSHVEGSQQAILNTQQASERYFQRPDNNHASVDSARRSLTGTGGAFVYGKRSGKWIYEIGATYLSPQLELNDIGFLTQTDQISQWIWTQYRILNPKGIFRSQRYNAVQYLGWDFDWRNTTEGYELSTNLDFKNFWSLGVGANYETHNISNADLRGGPAMYYPGVFTSWLWLGTDSRKKLQLTINPQWRKGMNDYTENRTLELGLIYKPTNALSITLAPNLSTNRNKLQYVTTGEIANEENRYVVAEINQTTARLTVRMTYMITPNLSIQYWGQPFGTAGAYSNYKYITNAGARVYTRRFSHVPNNWLALNDDGDEYSVNENNNATAAYTFAKPDFNIGQFRSNMVMRWEYIPGSTFFLVWAQEMNGSFYDADYRFSFSDKAHNIFLMKYTYRFIL
jgi:hypothetical protein